MKQCHKCHIPKPYTEFSKSTTRQDGMQPACKECNAKYRKANKTIILDYAKKYRLKYNESIKEKQKYYRSKNKDANITYQKEWRKHNRGLKNAHEAKRKSYRLQRTPKWLTEADWNQIKSIYTHATSFHSSRCHVSPHT